MNAPPKRCALSLVDHAFDAENRPANVSDRRVAPHQYFAGLASGGCLKRLERCFRVEHLRLAASRHEDMHVVVNQTRHQGPAAAVDHGCALRCLRASVLDLRYCAALDQNADILSDGGTLAVEDVHIDEGRECRSFRQRGTIESDA